MLWSAACSRISSSELTQKPNVPHTSLHSKVHACCKDMNVAAHKYFSSYLNVWQLKTNPVSHLLLIKPLPWYQSTRKLWISHGNWCKSFHNATSLLSQLSDPEQTSSFIRYFQTQFIQKTKTYKSAVKARFFLLLLQEQHNFKLSFITQIWKVTTADLINKRAGFVPFRAGISLLARTI